MGNVLYLRKTLALAIGLGSLTAFAQIEASKSLLNQDLYTGMKKILESRPSKSIPDRTRNRAADQKEVPFDLVIPRFETTDAGKKYLEKYGHKPIVADRFGYPIPKTNLKRQKPKIVYQTNEKKEPKPVLRPGPKKLPERNNPNLRKSRETSFYKMIFDLLIPSAVAYEYEEEVDSNGNHTGIMNCRDPNAPSNFGFFKAYFEDRADNNGLGSGAGYDEPTLGAGRRKAVCEVLEEIAHLVMMDEPNGATPEILFKKDMPPDAPTNALAAGSPYFGPSSTSSADSGYLHQHIISHNDPADGPDAIVYTNWNPSVSWSVDSTLNFGTYDFKTVMRHEVLHAMGFMSRLPYEITTSIYNTAIPHNHWDKNLFTEITSPYQNLSPFFLQLLNPLLQIPVGAPSLWFYNNQGFYQGRKNYLNAPYDPKRPLYTPSEFKPGSSLSHFDMERLVPSYSQTYVMHPSISTNIQREIHDHEKEVLCHIGYRVRPGCDIPIPTANDDSGTITSTTSTDIAFIANDQPPIGSTNATNLGLASIEFETPTNPSVTYYTGYTQTNAPTPPNQDPEYACTGSATTVSNGDAKCLRVSTPINLSIFKAKYRIKELNSSGISSPSSITYMRCVVSSPDEHICNGDFEMEINTDSPLNQIYTSPIVNAPFWFDTDGSSDLFGLSNSSTPTQGVNLPLLISNTNIVLQGYNNNQGVRGAHIGSMLFPSGPSSEASGTKLKKKLDLGACYQIQLDSTSTWKETPTQTDLNSYTHAMLILRLSTSNFASTNTPNPALLNAPVLTSFSVPLTAPNGNAVWNHFSAYFSPSASYEYISLMNNALSNSLIGLWFDNVSLRKVDPSFCSSNQNNKISGIVYNDINTNGQLTLGEQVLSNVPVKLYDSQDNLINITSTDGMGVYHFINLSPSSSYKVVLSSENLYQTITEPIANNPFNGFSANNVAYTFQHVRIVPFTNGGVVTGENFGILYQGQVPIIPSPSPSPSPSCTSQLIVNVQVNHATAPSFANGSVTATIASGGTAPYTYGFNGVYNGSQMAGPITATSHTWDNIAGTNIAHVLMVQDSRGCVYQNNNVHVYRKLEVNPTMVRNCYYNPAANVIYANATGGHNPYPNTSAPNLTYVWKKNGVVIPSLSSSVSSYSPTSIGNYTVTVSDPVGQVATSSIYYDGTLAPLFTLTGTYVNPTATSGGSITVNVNGGPTPYTYTITPPGTSSSTTTSATSKTYSNLSGGSYVVSVKNQQACMVSKTFNLKRYISSSKPLNQ